MPTLPFFKQADPGVESHRQVADASDFTRYKRMVAQASSFIGTTPKLGWRSPSVATDVRLISGKIGLFRSRFPNAS